MPPQKVALAMNSGVGGRMDAICSVTCSVIVEEEDDDDDECRILIMGCGDGPKDLGW